MLECRYASSIYYNQENGYTVAVYETEENIPEGKNEIGKRQFVAVGCELPRNEGIDISLKGQWQESEKYGKQYHVTSFQIQMPTTVLERIRQVPVKQSVQCLLLVLTSTERLLQVIPTVI